MNCWTGEAEHHEDSSFELSTVLRGHDWPKDVSLAEGEWRLHRFYYARDVGLESSEAFLVQLDAAWAGFLHVSDHLADTGDEVLGLNVAENLEDVSAMA